MLRRALTTTNPSRLARFSTAASPPSGGGSVLVPVAVLAALGGGVGYYYAFHDSTLNGLLPAPAVAPQPTPSPASASKAVSTAVPAAAAPPSSTPAPPLATSAKARLERAALALAITLQEPLAPRAVVASAPLKATPTAAAATPAAAAPPTLAPQPASPSTPSPSAQPAAAAAQAEATPAPSASSSPPSSPVPTSAAASAPPQQEPVAAALAKARGEVRTLIFGEIAGVLQKDFSESARAQVMGMTAEEAKAKALKLMEEDYSRARAEGLRLAELLERNEAAWTAKFEAFAQSAVETSNKQALEHLQRYKEEFVQSAEALLTKERETLTAAMQRELQSRLAHQGQLQSVQAGEAAAATLGRVTTLTQQVEALQGLLAARNAYEQLAGRVARVSLAVSALGEALATPGRGKGSGSGSGSTATGAIAALRCALGSPLGSSSSSSGDAIVDVALASLPAAVHSAGGVARVSDLRGAFSQVSTVGRRAAPGGSGLLGKALAGVGASIVLPAQGVVSEVQRSVREGLSSAQSGLKEAAAPYEVLQPLVRGVEQGWASVAGLAGAGLEAVRGGLRQAWGSVSGGAGAGAQQQGEAAAAPAAPSAEAGAGAPAPLTAALPRAEVLKASAEATLAKGREVFQSSEAGIRRSAAIFDAAEEAVVREDFVQAIAILSALRGEEGQELTMQWVAAAEQRVAVDRAFRLIRARTDLLTSSLY